MTPASSGVLLREVASAVLRDIDGLRDEGFSRAAAEKVTTHALALTARAADLAAFPDRQRMHGLGLWDLIEVLTGPLATALLRKLDEALGIAL